MTNKEIANILLQIAKIMELSGKEKDRFRIVAYEKASQAVESYGEDLADVYKRGGKEKIMEIEGIGESIAEKIEELIKTGKLKYFEELKKEVPKSEVEFLQIPGIGPKTAVVIAEKLKARDIDDLEKKIKSGAADKLFKEKTKANILRGIEILRRMEGRMLLTEAMPIAEEVVAYLKKVPGVERVDPVGSLRRWKETVGDVDIIASAREPKKVIDAFVKFPKTSNIITQGETKATIIHKDGVQIDLEILPKEKYGSLLQHFTGSKEHNVALRTYAVSKKYSVSEHGIKNPQGKLITCATEEEVYKTLGMDFIVPELREDRGEIAAALQHKLPKLIEPKDVKGDLHFHSNWSDGSDKIEDIAKAAQKLRYEYVAITDHSPGLGVAQGLKISDFDEREKEIEEAREKCPNIKILSSVEVNIKADGSLDLPDEMLAKLDVVTASIHSSFFQSQEQITKRLVGACENPNVDIIGHPSGRLLGRREAYDVDWEKLFQAAAKTNTALEINAFPDRLDLKDSLCQAAQKQGVKFVICTDGHRIGHLELMRFGVAVARRGWLEKDDILNTKGWDKLKEWLER
jgi:DNA polymerase (family 10)